VSTVRTVTFTISMGETHQFRVPAGCLDVAWWSSRSFYHQVWKGMLRELASCCCIHATSSPRRTVMYSICPTLPRPEGKYHFLSKYLHEGE
jgi:hypothetical protein